MTTEPNKTDMEDVLKKLSAALEATEGGAPLSKDEMTTVRDMIRAYGMLLSWGKLGRFLIWAVLTAAAVKAGADLLVNAGAAR